MDSRSRFTEWFGRPRALIGMIHVGALPGTPRAEQSLDAIAEFAVDEARAYREAGFTALLLENMHDRPYLKGGVGPEIVAAMTAIGRAVRHEVALPLGLQILAGANREALAVALAVGAAFVRVEGFVFAHVADEGLIESDAGPLLRYRRAIGAEHVAVFADVKKKHAAHALTADVDLAETARAAEFALADGVIVTGVATGREAASEDVAAVAAATSLPTLVGSGLTADNLARYAAAEGFIVGSSVKQGGVWSNPLDREHAAAMARAFHVLEKR
ncbi:MAG TPA: BtpA/SgcQ family protein [Candidatus Saccharimonadaceae bacterium]|jgi:membrane complex biogenesis BtpA family protein|nr:BtpA/SgcQ family protein [Candidatus Saccharimonadaceae bacterium]